MRLYVHTPSLRAWTQRQDLARAEYRRHPFAACRISRCDELAQDGFTACLTHRRDNQAAADRMAARRAS